LTEPAGPTYVALDADLQEQVLSGPVPEIDWSRVGPGRPIGPDPAALEEAAELLVSARRPVIVAGYAGRDPRAFSWVPELAELVGAAIVDTGDRLNAPTLHPLRLPAPDALADADFVLLLDLKDISRTLLTTDPPAREVRSRLPDGCRIVDIGFNELQVSSWVHDVGPALPLDLRVTADTSVALPLLISLVRERLAAEGEGRAAERARWSEEIGRRSASRRESWHATADERADERPISPSRLAADVWSVIREYDWVLTAGTADDWALRLWDFDRPYRHPGRSLGTATQIGMSLGVALAHRDTGRLVVDLQPDGDLLFDGAAPWIATQHGIPMLVVMFNNRAYWNDWEHQIRMAKARGSDPAKAHIGVAIDSPAPDFATLARAFDWWAEGPIEDPSAIRDAVARAVRVVMEERRPALVDVVTAHD
jgi:benzoylformate decarboxylase/acetolactate synthase-1/2/3 large subunit